MPKRKAKKSVSKKRSSAHTSPKTHHKKSNKNIAIIALLLNVLVVPGLGSLIAGKIKVGIWQLILAVVGALLSLIIIGIPILIAAWIWGLVTGINLVQEAK